MRFEPRPIPGIGRKKPSKMGLKLAIDKFMSEGVGYHTPMGLTLAPLLNHCIENSIPFWLYCDPKNGYHVFRPDKLSVMYITHISSKEARDDKQRNLRKSQNTPTKAKRKSRHKE
jgi:hypothetical protein